ncbi:MAG: TAXI family TRAP transporter solute-binding subunit [Lautropia sp.]
MLNTTRRQMLHAAAAAATSSVAAALGAPALAQAPFAWPRNFSVITPVVGTANHSLAVAWTSKFQAATKTRVAVLPAPNGFARANWLNTGEGRVGMLQASDYFDQMDAIQGYASEASGPHDTRVAHMNMVTPWGFVTRGDTAIKSFDDVGPGTKIALAKSSSFLVVAVNALLAYRGLKPSDVNLVEVGSYGANTAVLAEGRVDLSFTSPISGPSYQAEANPAGLRWLPLPERSKNPEAYDRYRKLMSGYVPRVTGSGVKSAIKVPMDHAYQCNHVRADEDPAFVHQLIKWLDENHESYKNDFTHAHLMTVASLVEFLEAGALQPMHEGTIRYLTEKGMWKPAFQARQDKLVALARKRVDGFKAAVAAARAKGLRVDPGNADWVKFWTDYRAKNGMATPYGEDVLALG